MFCGFGLTVWITQQVLNRTTARCVTLLGRPLPPPPYVNLEKVYKRHVEGERSVYVLASNGLPDAWTRSAAPIVLASCMAIFVCIALLARLAILGQSWFVSILNYIDMRMLLPLTQAQPCEFRRDVRMVDAER
jgi:hypothetical protein